MAKKLLSDQGPVSLGGGVDFLSGSKIMFVDTEGAPGAKPTTPISRLQMQGSDVLHWGIGNDLPQDIIALALQSPELLSLIEFMITVIYGDGVGYEVLDGVDADGAPKYRAHYDQEVEDWMTGNDIQTYLFENIADLVWFNNAFSEMIKNKRGDKICQVTHQEAAFCRFNRQNPDTGYNDKVYISANWPSARPDDSYTTTVSAINKRDLYKVENTFKSAESKFIFPLNFPFPGNIAYQYANWHSLFTSKWYNINILIPVLKYSLMKFQMTIKYVMEVPEEFWRIQGRERNKVWDTMSPAEKKSLKATVKKEMDDFLTGAENTGKTLMTTFGWDPIGKVKIPGLTVTVLDDKLQDGKYIMDSKETSGQFSRAFGIPQPLMGPISAGDMGAGSGSDARIHWNMLNSRIKAKKEMAVADLNFIAQYNGWTTRMKGFRFKIKDIVLDTLDVNHSTANPATMKAAA